MPNAPWVEECPLLHVLAPGLRPVPRQPPDSLLPQRDFRPDDLRHFAGQWFCRTSAPSSRAGILSFISALSRGGRFSRQTPALMVALVAHFSVVALDSSTPDSA